MAVRAKAKSAAARAPRWLPPVEDPRAEAILLAAFDVFVEAGYEGATMLEIATRAKVSKLTLYALFRDKDGLFAALVAWGAKRFELQSAAFEAQAAADPMGALLAYALENARMMLRWQSMALLRIGLSQQARAPEIAVQQFELNEGGRRSIAAALARRLADVGMIEGDIDGFVDDFFALLRGDLFYRTLAGAAPAPSKAAVEAHVRRAVGRLLKAYAPEPRPS